MRKLLVILSVSAAACGGSSSNKGNQAGTVDQFCPSVMNALAAKFAQCYNSPADAWQTLLGQAQTCSDMSKAVKAGRAKYDASQGSACLAEVNKASCSDLQSFGNTAGDPCNTAVQGQVPANGSCYSGTDCVDQGSCSAGSSACPGTCSGVAHLGQSCASLSCDNYTTCMNSMCMEPAGAGQACMGGTHPSCGGGYYCQNGSNATAGVCQPKQTSGSCSYGGSECALGYNCIGATSTGTAGTCQQAKAVGATCTQGNGECAFLTYCGSNNQCTEYPKTGGTCGIVNMKEYAACLGSYCSGAAAPTYTGTCAAYKNVGDSCTGSDECGDGYCDSTSSKCVAACHEA